MNILHFSYTEAELDHLKKKDKKLAAAIGEIGALTGWHVEPDIFSALVHHIAGQQISTQAQRTVWGRISAGIKEVTPENVRSAGVEKMQSFGISFRKAEYITELAQKTASGEFDPAALWEMDDEDVIKRYRKRYSPCGSLASLYLWEIAGGAIPGMTDRAPKTAGKKGAAAR